MSSLMVLERGRHQMEGINDILQLSLLGYVVYNRSLEFLPKILSLVAMAPTVTVGGNYKYILKYHK